MPLPYARYRNWRPLSQQKPKRGILVGCNASQEWLLPWWWNRYRAHNALEVAFADLGMTNKGKRWCEERGERISLLISDLFVPEKEEMALSVIEEWEGMMGKHIWGARSGWFKKPVACLQTPFEETAWLDLDCEVRGSLDPLFGFATDPSGVAMARWTLDGNTFYNSGVVVFRYNAPLIQAWAEMALDQNGAFIGDEDMINHLIRENQMRIGELPLFYNWSRRFDDNEAVQILHCHGPFGKQRIIYQLFCEEHEETLPSP